MAIGATFKSAVHSTSNATSYATTTSFTPAAGSLLLAFIFATGDNVAVPGFTGNGLTWTAITGINLSTTARLEVWAALAGSAPSAGVQTAGTWGVAKTGCHITVIEVTGAYVSGTTAQAIVQSPSNTGTATSGSVTLATAAKSNNRAFSGFGHAATEATTERVNWSELDDGNVATPASAFEAQWRSDAFETTASATWTTSSSWCAIAVEVQAAVGLIPETRRVQRNSLLRR